MVKYFLYTVFILVCLFALKNIFLSPDSYTTMMERMENLVLHVGNSVAGVFFTESRTIAQLQNKYEEVLKNEKKQIRILVVPGHEPNFGGTEYNGLKERDMVVILAEELNRLFQTDSHFEIIVARGKDAWDPILSGYFTNHIESIIAYRERQKSEMTRLINLGRITEERGVSHNAAPNDVSNRLYGINMWANENKVDIVLNLHINDYPHKDTQTPGKYSGFTIYVPERQYSNSTSSHAIAKAIFNRLSKYNAVSDMPIENIGVVEDQELIAIGRYNTMDAPSMLIEYGYIYEGQYEDPRIRDVVLKDLAYQTYVGIQDFFKNSTYPQNRFSTTLLPHLWSKNLDQNTLRDVDILALQTALTFEGIYPPAGKTKNECPLTGRMRDCTLKALSQFQQKHGILNEPSVVGMYTREVLNKLYSQ